MFSCQHVMVGTLNRLPVKTGGRWDDVKSVWSLCPGLHTCYNGVYNGKLSREVEQILKTSPSSDCSLKLDYMKLESLVKVYQLRYLEYVPGSCTHRPSHHGSELHPKLLIQPVKGGRHLRCDS